MKCETFLPPLDCICVCMSHESEQKRRLAMITSPYSSHNNKYHTPDSNVPLLPNFHHPASFFIRARFHPNHRIAFPLFHFPFIFSSSSSSCSGNKWQLLSFSSWRFLSSRIASQWSVRNALRAVLVPWLILRRTSSRAWVAHFPDWVPFSTPSVRVAPLVKMKQEIWSIALSIIYILRFMWASRK